MMVLQGRIHTLGESSSLWTSDGWRDISLMRPGQVVAGVGGPRAITALEVTESHLFRVQLRDGTALVADANTRLQVARGLGVDAPTHTPTLEAMTSWLERGPLRTTPSGPAELGSSEQQLLPLPPYVLGVLLGDGYLRDGHPQLCARDPELVRLFAEALPQGARLGAAMIGAPDTGYWSIKGPTRGQNPVRDAIRSLGLANHRAHEKFIPKIYLVASAADRLRLLAGILDTDGHVDRAGRIEFSSSSHDLACDVQQLVASLGGTSRLGVKRNVFYTSPRQPVPVRARDAYRLTSVRVPGRSIFRLPRKAERERDPRLFNQWRVVSVEELGVARSVRIETLGSGPLVARDADGEALSEIAA